MFRFGEIKIKNAFEQKFLDLNGSFELPQDYDI